VFATSKVFTVNFKLSHKHLYICVCDQSQPVLGAGSAWLPRKDSFFVYGGEENGSVLLCWYISVWYINQ